MLNALLDAVLGNVTMSNLPNFALSKSKFISQQENMRVAKGWNRLFDGRDTRDHIFYGVVPRGLSRSRFRGISVPGGVAHVTLHFVADSAFQKAVGSVFAVWCACAARYVVPVSAGILERGPKTGLRRSERCHEYRRQHEVSLFAIPWTDFMILSSLKSSSTICVVQPDMYCIPCYLIQERLHI